MAEYSDFVPTTLDFTERPLLGPGSYSSSICHWTSASPYRVLALPAVLISANLVF